MWFALLGEPVEAPQKISCDKGVGWRASWCEPLELAGRNGEAAKCTGGARGTRQSARQADA